MTYLILAAEFAPFVAVLAWTFRPAAYERVVK
jgi:hypothetical protein